ncbi:gfo/Idh/MocA family oxidoreductase [bacterium]|nr:gfo/Idh/MocA family oxidoreductase [bacterium]
MVRIGIVGIGFMGWTHFAAATKLSEAGKPTGSKLKGGAVTAICTRSAAKLSGDWTSIQGNFGPRAPQLDLSKISAYDNHKDLIADPDIDLVDVCLPNDQHEEVAIAALQAGKHVLVEKPISVDPKGADRMVAAAKKAGKLLMVAHVLPFFPEFQFASQIIQSQKYGKLLAAHFRRVISPPKWSGDMSDFRKLGGWGIDLHIHDNHFIRLACGLPEQVSSRGLLQEGFVNHVHTQYVYPNGPTVTSVSGGICAQGLAFAHGYELYFENATVIFSAGTVGDAWCVDRPLSVISKGKVTHPKLKGGSEWCSAFTSELQTAVDSVKSGEPAPLLSGELARDALQICHAEAKSIATGKSVKL